MKKNVDVYSRLRKHLDAQAVGFPATPSGAEIRILKHIFSPSEAELATCLSFRFESTADILEKASRLVDSIEELEARLETMLEKGGIEVRVSGNEKFYCNSPLIVGMYEMQLNRLTPEFIKDFREYTSDIRFGLDFLGTDLPQMRTIPVSRSIKPQHNVSTYDEVTALITDSPGPFAAMKCICREKRSMEGHTCEKTRREETCLAIGDMAHNVLLTGKAREVNRKEILEILEMNQKDGLVLQPSNTEKIDFICSCCGCCCGMLGIQKHLPRPMEFWTSNYYAVVDEGRCDGCGTCKSRCQVEAIELKVDSKPAIVNLDRCIGCGLCVTTCFKQAITLARKEVEVKPPENREVLYENIYSNRKGSIGKIGMAGKLLTDAVRARDFKIIKK